MCFTIYKYVLRSTNDVDQLVYIYDYSAALWRKNKHCISCICLPFRRTICLNQKAKIKRSHWIGVLLKLQRRPRGLFTHCTMLYDVIRNFDGRHRKTSCSVWIALQCPSVTLHVGLAIIFFFTYRLETVMLSEPNITYKVMQARALGCYWAPCLPQCHKSIITNRTQLNARIFKHRINLKVVNIY